MIMKLVVRTIKPLNFLSGLVLILCVVLFTNPVNAQKPSIFQKLNIFQNAKADKLFENKQYYAAAQAFEKELTDDKGGDPIAIRKKIGLCYLKINQPQKALPWLQQLTISGIADADTWYQYGLALQQTANYREAIPAFEECLAIQPGHPSAGAKIESCNFAMTHSRVNTQAKFRIATEINTTGGEFGASLYDKNMVYYSTAAAPNAGSRIDPQTGLQYVQTYMMRMQNKRLIYPQVADNTLPRFVSDELFAYDSLSHSVYFAYYDQVNNRNGIYTSNLVNGKWSDPQVIIQNKKDQATGHPALANGGKRLFFTSNSSDGVGQTDIWYIDKSEDGVWSQPVNAGNTINTFGREEFPFVYADSLLFFASDGHVGYGGLDIFCSIIDGNTISPPVNLRRPFNSPGDDFSLVINRNMGLLSSSRNEHMSDDMYFFEGLPSFLYLSGQVTDHVTGDILANARLTLSIDGSAVYHTVSDSTGYYGFFLREDESPMMYARTIGYKPSLTDVFSPQAEQFTDFQHDVQLEQSTVLPATILLYNKLSGEPVSEQGIICFNNDGETQILRTDASGSFKLTMQEDQREYWVKFPNGNYLTENIILNDQQKSYSLAVQPINSDLFSGWLSFKRGSTEATELSRALVPQIASVIKANPDMVFLIEGFCDSGFEARQQDLATQRAEYIVNRLMDEGVEPRQLSASVGQATATTEEEDSSQRRVEIRIKR